MGESGRNLVNPNDAAALLAALQRGEKPSSSYRPEVHLPGGGHTITDAALGLGRLMARSEKYFHRGNGVVRVVGDSDRVPSLEAVKASALTSAFEKVSTLVRSKLIKGEWVAEPAVCGETMAKQILDSDDFREMLPPLRLLCRCPVLIERNGKLKEVVGYDRKSGIYTTGVKADKVSLEQARELLNGMLDGFCFATHADRARALAAVITPALVFGDMLGGRAPLDLGEADKSQTGKGFRNKLTAAVYGQDVITINQVGRGVGGMEETFDTAVMRGANFICLDNMKGCINSTKIESFLREDRYQARAPYSPAIDVDPRMTFVMLTSNKADITVDLANRSACVKLKKHSAGHHHKRYPEGDILNHVKAHQPRYLGAVFAVIRAWHAAGKPLSDETRHDFREWVQTLDCIIQQFVGGEPIMQGHRATQDRMTNPTLNWLRDVTLLVKDRERLGDWMRAYELVNLLEDSDVEIPGLSERDILEDETVRKRVLQGVGRKMAACFRQVDDVEVDSILCERREVFDSVKSKLSKEYRFTEMADRGENEVPF
jgi:hypothetical protein